jgi:ribosomal protein L19
MNLQTIDKWIKNTFSNKSNHTVNVGDTVKIVIRLNEQAKNKAQKTQIIHGLVIAKKHGSEIGSTITIRRIVSGVGIE